MTPAALEPHDRSLDQEVLEALRTLGHWDALTASGAVDPVDSELVRRLAAGVASSSALPFRVPARPGRRQRAAVPRPRTRGWYLGAAALVAAVTAAVVVIPSLGERPAQVAEAAAVLEQAADAASSASGPIAASDQWWRIRSVITALQSAGGEAGASATYEMRLVRTEYVPVDVSRPSYLDDSSSVVLRHVSGPVEPRLPARPASTVMLAPGSTDLRSAPRRIAGLPRDTTSLRAALYAEAASTDLACAGADECVAALIRDDLMSGVAPTDLRVALYRVLATVPGVTVVGRDVVLAGRSGVGLTWLAPAPQDPSTRVADPASGTRTDLVIDPSTGELLGIRVLSFDDSAESRAAPWWRAAPTTVPWSTPSPRRSSTAQSRSVPGEQGRGRGPRRHGGASRAPAAGRRRTPTPRTTTAAPPRGCRRRS